MSLHSRADDEEITRLAVRAGRGDRRALSAFIRATQDDAWRLLAHLAGRQQADDLTQETFLRVINALPRFAARSSARTWLLAIARRVWVDSVRKDVARPQDRAAADEDAVRRVPARGSDEQSISEWLDVRRLIDELAPERREALILTQILGYSYEETARITGVRLGTVRSRVARARGDLIAARAAAAESPTTRA
ncbi:sigma-70 family RNA polymerase sigma factor [Corynebacterium otitidis]